MALSTAQSRLAVLALLPMLLTACAGPKAPIQVGVRELPSDVVLKGRTAPTGPEVRAPIPPIALPREPSQILAFPVGPAFVPTTDVDAPPPPPAASPAPPITCPPTPADAPPADAAPSSITLPPSPARYAYTASGSFEVSGPNAGKGPLPDRAVRTVRDSVRLPGSGSPRYRFTVDAELGSLVTSTTYTLVPEPAASLDAAAGLYISRISSRNADGSSDTFTPMRAPGMLLLPFPATSGATFRESAVDATSGTAMSYTGTVGSHRRVTACGTALDAIAVRLEGEIGPGAGRISPSGSDAFTADYSLGTAYGGISLSDTVTLERTGPSSGFFQTSSATITRRPVAALRSAPSCADPCEP